MPNEGNVTKEHNEIDKVNEIHVYPTKKFFIEMLTRDISIVDAVLELVDNSVDKAVERSGLDVMSALLSDTPPESMSGVKVSLSFSSNHFRIEDTSGGISREKLRNNVFMFGSTEERDGRTGLSAYGIGMKRSFFKLGRYVKFKTRTETETSALIWDILKWQENSDWTLEFMDEAAVDLDFVSDKPGTVIDIKNLTEAVSQVIGEPLFTNQLVRRLGITYALFLKYGLEISVNGNSVTQTLPEILNSNLIGIGRRRLNENGVDILIIVGLTPQSDSIPKGWYVFCNGRTVVEADKTYLTGWGDALPRFHPKYNHFVGFVLFSSQNVQALPWTTTKQGVERDAHIYRVALGEMARQGRLVTGVLDDFYQDSNSDEDEGPGPSILQSEEKASVFEVSKQDRAFTLPSNVARGPKYVNIAYKRLETEVNELKKALGNSRMSNKELGHETFDYVAEREQV